MKDEIIKNLLKQKDHWEHVVTWAIEQQENPFNHGYGKDRLEECRTELARIDKQLGLVGNWTKT